MTLCHGPPAFDGDRPSDAIRSISESLMNPVKNTAGWHLPVSALVLAALFLSSLPVLAGCEGGGTTNQVLLEHSGSNMDSPYRRNSHGSHR
jgi:hypothetical protein